MALKGLTLAFWDFPKPSVVAVNGLAVGGAANIALANYHDGEPHSFSTRSVRVCASAPPLA